MEGRQPLPPSLPVSAIRAAVSGVGETVRSAGSAIRCCIEMSMPDAGEELEQPRSGDGTEPTKRAGASRGVA
jgi:hypothetical protein